MLIIGEKLNGSIKSVAEAIRKRDGEFIRALASKQIECGAEYLDICSGKPGEDAEILKWMTELIQADHPDVKFSLDSPNPDTILRCIPLCKNPGIINSVSLEGDKIKKLFPAVSKNKGWRMIALLLDGEGMPKTMEKRMRCFHIITDKAKEYGVSLDRIYFDPLVFAVGTSPDSFINFIKTTDKIKEEYPAAHIVCGLSNISYGLPYRKAINQVFLAGALAHGTDAAIMDPLDRDLTGTVYAAEALSGKDDHCIKYLSAYRKGLFG